MIPKFIKIYVFFVLIWFFASFFVIGSKAIQSKMNQEVMVLKVSSLKLVDTGFSLKNFSPDQESPLEEIFSDLEMKLRIGFR